MNITKYNCVICHIPFDDSIHLPRILNLCGHTACSLCISKKLISNKKNTFSCPKDNTIYSKIENIDYFRINKSILDKIKENKKDTIDNNNLNDSSKFDNILSEKVSVHTQKSTKTKIDTITINDNSIINNTAISLANNNPNGHQCYIKKIIKFGKKLKFSKNSSICSIHSLPLNIICVNDQQKICSQCALNNVHLNHQIIPENKFIDYVDELVKVYQEIENNLNKYGDITNFNNYSVLEKIEIKINKFKNNIIKICDDLIDNINGQCKQILKYLDLRKNEIFKKYQSTNYDINNLKDSANNWIDIACNKLIQASSGNADELHIESLRLLDNDENKNVFNLINSGKQLNERYNFISETKSIFDKLKEFSSKGMNLETNYKIIDSIMINSNFNEGIKETKIYNNYNYNESIINTKGNNISTLGNTNINNKSINLNINSNNNSNIFETSLFKFEENKDIIDFLHLTPISILYKQTKNIFITYENDDLDFNSEPYNTITNNSNLFSPKFKLQYNNINKNIYSKKTINSNHKYNTYKNEFFISFRNDNMSRTQNNFYDLSNRINLINFKENQKSKSNRLALSGNIRNKIQSDKNLYQSFKRILYPKLEKVKTCDVIFLGSKNRKRKESFNLTDIDNKKYKQEKTFLRLPMSPQLKSAYNLLNNNTKIKDINFPIQVINSQKNKNKNKKKNTRQKVKEKKEEKNDKEKNDETKYKTKYIRCVSCSGALNKKDIQDISILFNLKDKDIFSPGRNKKLKNLFQDKKNKIKIKENEKDSDISDITNNNNISNYSHNLNRSCTKHNSKTYYNFRNKNGSKTKAVNTSFINKDINELQKIINTQMKKSNPVFNRINMTEHGTQLLCEYMQNNKNKKYNEMKLPGCNLNDNDFCMIVKSLIENEIELPILNLSYNKISDNSAKYIFEIITKKSCVKNIYLYNNIFSKSFIDKIKNYNKDKNVDYVKIFT